jgi:hypothetical protein
MFNKNKDEISSTFLRSSIENNFCDLIEQALQLNTYDTEPKLNSEWLLLATESRCSDAISMLTKLEFDVSDDNIVEYIAKGLAYNSTAPSCYLELITYIGKERLTQMVLHSLERETLPSKSPRTLNAISILFNDCDNEKQIPVIASALLNNINLSQLTKKHAIQVFREKGVFNNTYSVKLLEIFYKLNLLDDLSDEEKSELAASISKSTNTDLVSFCLNNNIFSVNNLIDVTNNQSSVSFSLLAELHYQGHSIFNTGRSAINNPYTQFSIQEFLMCFSEKLKAKKTDFNNKAFCLFMETFVSEYLEKDDSDSRVDGQAFLMAMFKSLDAELLIEFTNRILSKSSDNAKRKFFHNLLSSNAYLRNLARNSFNKEKQTDYVSFLANNLDYQVFLQRYNKEISESNSAYSRCYSASNYYLVDASKNENFNAMSTLLEKTSPCQKVVSQLLEVARNEQVTMNKNTVITYISILTSYLTTVNKALEFNKATWNIDTESYSVAREMAALEKAKTQSIIVDKVTSIATAPQEKVTSMINNTHKSKKSLERISLLLNTRNISPMDALSIEGLAPKGQSAIMEAMTHE